MAEIKRIGILTGGGDCPGLNAVIRAITRNAILEYGVEVVGFVNGYDGLYKGNTIELDLNSTSGILHKGGTILHSSNKTNLFRMPFTENGETVYKDLSDIGVENLEKAGVDVLIVIGGDGTLTSARDFHRKGVKIIGVPKTIDNDLPCTDVTFGFDTAVAVATEALDRLHTTAESHHRIMCLEVMGRYVGWIALKAGLAGGADAILIPEIPYDINKVAEKIKERRKAGKEFSIVVVAEGAKPLSGEMVVRTLLRTVQTQSDWEVLLNRFLMNWRNWLAWNPGQLSWATCSGAAARQPMTGLFPPCTVRQLLIWPWKVNLAIWLLWMVMIFLQYPWKKLSVN